MPRAPRLALALALGASVALWPAALQTAEAAPASPPTPGDPVAIVLDASGSMTTPDAGGTTRIDAAKNATSDLITQLGPERRFSLLTYGTGTGSEDADKPAGCRDITTLRPLGAGDLDATRAVVAGVTPRGYTPVGSALRAAADSLPATGARSIVLVSDGEDTCAPPPPCDVAKELRQRGVDLVVNTVGLNIDPRGREELRCVAEATGGTYADATDTAGLTRTMSTAARAAQAYRLSGNRVEGAAGHWSVAGPVPGWLRTVPLDAAPTVQPGTPDDPLVLSGDLPAFPADFPPAEDRGTLRAYRVHLRAGDTLRIGALSPGRVVRGAGQDAAVSTLRLGVVPPAVGGQDRTVMLGGWGPRTLDGRPTTADQTVRANVTGDHTVLVERRGPLAAGESVPYELRLAGYRATSPADGTGAEFPADLARDLPLAPQAPAVQGGTEPASATPVTPGTVTGEIVPGETRFYRMHVGWGQSALVNVGVDEPGDAPGRADCLEPHLLSPLVQRYDDNGVRGCWAGSGTDLAHVRAYRSIGHGLTWRPESTAPDLAGEQLVAITLNSTQTTDPAAAARPMRFRMAVDVRGEQTPAPTFDALGEGPDSATTTAPASSGPTSETSPVTTESSESGSSWLVPVAGVVGALVLGVAGIVTAVRASKRRR